MTGERFPETGRLVTVFTVPSKPTTSVPRKSRGRRAALWIAAAVGAAGLFLALVGTRSRSPLSPSGGSTPPAAGFQLEDEAKVYASYAGSESCRECHQEADELWRTSHHQYAERSPTPSFEAPAFDPPRTFRHASQSTAVRTGQAHYEIAALGLSGNIETHRVDRVLGHLPLRQFLLPAPGGRWQVSEAAYDPRSNAWFNVYGHEDRRPGEWGHWTGRGMNWNVMCAGCHNTRVRKNYDAATDTYRTTMAERTVGCEACHGPLRSHVDWQKAYGKSGQPDPTIIKPTRAQILDTCGFCHARRSDLTGDFKPGDLFEDHQELVVPDHSDLFYPDGQVRDEDYELAAFLGSKMHARGVMCLDCHNPHSGKTILPGNWLCMRCHNGTYPQAPTIEPVAHSHHRVHGLSPEGDMLELDLANYDPSRIAETGGECVNCHMPQTPYMQRHWRHDHGFTIPDPQLTREWGIPNACNRCHQDKSVDWAIAYAESWYGPAMERPSRERARWLARARKGDAAAQPWLIQSLAGDASPYWKAVYVEHLRYWTGEPPVGAAFAVAARHTNALVRTKAVRALESWLDQPGHPARRIVEASLQDPVRSVRLAAAWALRAVPEMDSMTASTELKHVMALNADQPLGQLQLAVWELARGAPSRAMAHLQQAVKWDPNSAPFRHELAILLSQAGRAGEAVEQLEAACRLEATDAEYRFKLALAYHESGRRDRVEAALREAVRLNPRHARAWYNLGLVQHANGASESALESLRHAESSAPHEPQFPYARATILAQLGRRMEAREAVGRALEISPGFPEARQLQQVLERSPTP